MGDAATQGRDTANGALVVDAIDQFATSWVRRAVLEKAFAIAGINKVPDSINDLTFFVTGPLYEVTAKTVSTEFADGLLDALSPVLDQAWSADHDGGGESSRPPKESTIRRARRDTRPPKVPSSPLAKRITPPAITVTSLPHSMMVIDSDRDTRLTIATRFSHEGYGVITAANPEEAAVKFERYRPAVVVANVETIAPDFEPLRTTLDELFGSDQPKIVLLGDRQPRELPNAVATVIPRPWSQDDLVDVVTTLLPL